MKIETSISKIGEEDIIIRGEKLSNLIKDNSFSDTIFFLLRSKQPTEVESKIFSSILVSIIDHGAGTCSSMTTRFVMSGGNPLNAAVAAGALALGDYHGGATEDAMKQFEELISKNEFEIEEFVKTSIENKKVIFGYGHKVYKKEDPRVREISKICKENNYNSKYIDIALKIEKLIENIKGKKLVLNIDGLMASILLEMGFSSKVGKGIFIIGRTPGLVAQALEESEEKKKVRRLEEENITYKK